MHVDSFSNLADYLAHHASTSPTKTAFIYLDEVEANKCSVTYADIHTRVSKLASQLIKSGFAGKQAMLLYGEGLEFIIAFLACLRASVTAVPMFLPRSSKHMGRLTTIIEDSQASVILTSDKYVGRIQTGLAQLLAATQLPIVATDAPTAPANAAEAMGASAEANPIAFIQYTSGSTGKPKGVTVSQQNLLHNQRLIQQAFGCTKESIIGSWLPFYHDMGLIGNILHTIFTGGMGVLMSPFYFLQKPLRWLQAISDYRITHSGGPNFAFDLCVERVEASEVEKLDLSCWQVAYNGAEPLRASTLANFQQHFRSAGFRADAFYPCYGLAEATLLVAGGKSQPEYHTLTVDAELLSANKLALAAPSAANAKQLVGSGEVAEGMHVKILATASAQEVEELQIGEVCIAGESVSAGYWKMRPERTIVAGAPEQAFFRTGDLGFFYQQQLYITGRLKELLIIRGKNYYPYDIEFSASTAHEALEKNGVAAFSVEIAGREELIVMAELKRLHARTVNTLPIIKAVEHRVLEEVGLKPYDVVLVPPMSIPRTSSGKIQRLQCGLTYRQTHCAIPSESQVVVQAVEAATHTWYVEKVKLDGTLDTIQKYLESVLNAKLPHGPVNLTETDLELTALGIDSLRSMEIINTINRDLEIQLDATLLFQISTVRELASKIELSLWLNSNQENGKTIVL